MLLNTQVNRSEYKQSSMQSVEGVAVRIAPINRVTSHNKQCSESSLDMPFKLCQNSHTNYILQQLLLAKRKPRRIWLASKKKKKDRNLSKGDSSAYDKNTRM